MLAPFALNPADNFLQEPDRSDRRRDQQIGQGQVVTKILDTGTKYGMLVFGAVYVNAPAPKFAAAYRNVKKKQLPQRQGLHLGGRSSARGQAADHRRLRAPRAPQEGCRRAQGLQAG